VPRFEYYDAEASFWDITLVGKTITTRWGRAASRGVAKVKHYADDDEARRDYDKQIKAKRKKGYKLVAGTEEPEAKRREAPAATSSMRNPELEAAVILNPNDDATLLVLAPATEPFTEPLPEASQRGSDASAVASTAWFGASR
jgi:predicted DNA-binding WGR domain protein